MCFADSKIYQSWHFDITENWFLSQALLSSIAPPSSQRAFLWCAQLVNQAPREFSGKAIRSKHNRETRHTIGMATSSCITMQILRANKLILQKILYTLPLVCLYAPMGVPWGVVTHGPQGLYEHTVICQLYCYSVKYKTCCLTWPTMGLHTSGVPA